MNLLPELTAIFGAVALLALVASGFTLMFAPEAGRKILKNVCIALALFVLGSMMLSASCGALR